MFAIIRVGGKQYRVENGTQLLVDRLHVEEKSAVEGAEVLMLVDGDSTQIGTPVVEGVEVGITAVKHTLGKKIRVFKYKAKKNYRRRIGSRPHQTLIRIDSIGGNSQLNAPAKSAAPVAEPVKSEPVAAAPVEVETVEVEPVVTPVEAQVAEPEVVEVVAVVDAPEGAEAVEAIKEIPGVESVEIETPGETA